MKWFLDRDRPGEEFSLVSLHDAAFPSAHVAAVTSSGMATIQLAMPVLRRTAKKLLDLAIIALIGAVALSRVWVGAHWLTDVIGGLIAGIIGLIIALLVLRRWPRARRYAHF
jgi:membrane-associated phospholipid phosphatase